MDPGVGELQATVVTLWLADPVTEPLTIFAPSGSRYLIITGRCWHPYLVLHQDRTQQHIIRHFIHGNVT